jgi:hypothetical protein
MTDIDFSFLVTNEIPTMFVLREIFGFDKPHVSEGYYVILKTVENVLFIDRACCINIANSLLTFFQYSLVPAATGDNFQNKS